jgi:hypothetical protein
LATDKLLDKIWDYKQIRPRIMPPRYMLVKGDCIRKLHLQIFCRGPRMIYLAWSPTLAGFAAPAAGVGTFGQYLPCADY